MRALLNRVTASHPARVTASHQSDRPVLTIGVVLI